MTPEAVITLLKAGHTLHMQFSECGKVWWLQKGDHHTSIPEKMAAAVIASGKVEEAGDSLFEMETNSQTYRLKKRKRK